MSTPTSPSSAAPRAPMLSTADALATLLAAAKPLIGTEMLSTSDALNRVLAADVVSPLDVPPMHTSAMDGYAVRVADLAQGSRHLPVSQRIPAGHAPQPLVAGTAARIFTGATVPPGADAVVMQEQTETTEGAVTILHTPKAGEWITAQGADIRKDTVILPAGTRLTPAALGLAASVGCATLMAARRVKVAVFFTGDELTMPGEPLKPGAIYNSNRFTLTGLLRNLGCEVTDYGIVPDQLDLTRATLREAAGAHDLILTSGGVSVGEEDHLKPALAAEGRLDLWAIAIKPGKPLAFGSVRRAEAAGGRSALFIGLPGNPVSSFVTYLLCVAPVLRGLQGLPGGLPPALPMRADFDWARPDRRREFLRARFNADGGLELFTNQSSGVLTSVVWADGLIDNPSGQPISRGDMVRFLPMSSLIGR